MAYRRSITGLTRLEPAELAERWDHRPCRQEVPDERRHELRMTRRAVERGFALGDQTRSRMVEVVEETLDDFMASTRDKLNAVDAGIKMATLNAKLDHDEIERESVPWPNHDCPDLVHARRTIRAWIEYGSAAAALEAGAITQEDMRRAEFTHQRAWDDPRLTTESDKEEIARYLLETCPEMFPETAEKAKLTEGLLAELAVPDRVCPEANETDPTISAVRHPSEVCHNGSTPSDMVAGFAVEALRAYPDTARSLEKAGRIPDGTCAALGIGQAAPPAPTWEDLFDAATDHAARMDVVASLRRQAADGDETAQFYLKHGGNTKAGGLRHFLEANNGCS
jgi:hypothetical protein